MLNRRLVAFVIIILPIVVFFQGNKKLSEKGLHSPRGQEIDKLAELADGADDPSSHLPSGWNPGKEEGSVVFVGDIEEVIKGPPSLPADNELLVEYIRSKMLPAANSDSPLNIRGAIHMGQEGQVNTVADYFKHKKGGFFFEVGAYDGEYISNTLFLETNLSWTGMLVEPNGRAFATLKTRNRKSKLLNACLSINLYPEEVMFDHANDVGGIVELDSPGLLTMRSWIDQSVRSQYKVQCYPFYSILLALGNPRIDFLSMDMEGAETRVLERVPWDKINIQSILIEVTTNREGITTIIEEAGYEIQHSWGTPAQDIFFVKKQSGGVKSKKKDKPVVAAADNTNYDDDDNPNYDDDEEDEDEDDEDEDDEDEE